MEVVIVISTVKTETQNSTECEEPKKYNGTKSYNNLPVTKHKDMELYVLYNKEFKIAVLKMKWINTKQNAITNINSRIDQIEEKKINGISEIEDRDCEITPSENNNNNNKRVK